MCKGVCRDVLHVRDILETSFNLERAYSAFGEFLDPVLEIEVLEGKQCLVLYEHLAGFVYKVIS